MLLALKLLLLPLLLLLTASIVSAQRLIHTFDTQQSCLNRCGGGLCVQENSADLMMPRWVCGPDSANGGDQQRHHPKNINSYQDMDDYEDGSSSSGPSMPSLAVLVPLCILVSVFFLFVCVSCTLRFLRG